MQRHRIRRFLWAHLVFLLNDLFSGVWMAYMYGEIPVCKEGLSLLRTCVIASLICKEAFPHYVRPCGILSICAVCVAHATCQLAADSLV